MSREEIERHEMVIDELEDKIKAQAREIEQLKREREHWMNSVKEKTVRNGPGGYNI